MTERLYNCLVGDFPSMKPGGDEILPRSAV